MRANNVLNISGEQAAVGHAALGQWLGILP